MEDFLHSNPGLASRFPKTLVFADYTPPQLLAIFQGLCRKNGYTLPPETEAAAAARFQALYAGPGTPTSATPAPPATPSRTRRGPPGRPGGRPEAPAGRT